MKQKTITSMKKSLRFSIIIPTKDREKDLTKCINSILKQKVNFNYEIIIIDDGNLNDELITNFKNKLSKKNIFLTYIKKDGEPGTAKSRNMGIRLSHGEIIFFLDDDIVLAPRYFNEILKMYNNNKIAGVSGLIINQEYGKEGFIGLIAEKLGWIDKRYGKVSKIGINKLNRLKSEEIREIDWMPTCCASYRKKILLRYEFDDKFYTDYSLGEDLDLSFRISREHILVVNPKAKLYHFNSEIGRDYKKIGFMSIYNSFYFFNKNLNGKLFDKISFLTYITISPIAIMLSKKPFNKKVLFIFGQIKALLNVYCRLIYTLFNKKSLSTVLHRYN